MRMNFNNNFLMFLYSDYCTEDNFISKTAEIASILNMEEPELIQSFKNLNSQIAPYWLKEENRSEELKLFFEIHKTEYKNVERTFLVNELNEKGKESLLIEDFYD